MPYAVRRKADQKYLGRGRGQSRKWTNSLQEADLWDQKGPGRIAAKESYRYGDRKAVQTEDHEYVQVHIVTEATMNRLDVLLLRERQLASLHVAGVDGWEGYDMAMEID